jgi:hypothetical protein
MQQVNSTEIRNVLGNMKYPALKQQIIDEAKKQNVSNEAIQILENIPNKEYRNSADIIEEFEGFQKAVQVFHNRKYPATKQELVKEAKNLHIRSVIIRALEACPEKEYSNSADVINECRAILQSK